MIEKKVIQKILKHFSNKKDAFWYGSNWNNLSDLDDFSILMFYFYYFQDCNKDKSLLKDFFFKNYHSNTKKVIKKSFESKNYFHLRNFTRLLNEYEYISEDITELYTYLDNLTIETEIKEVSNVCNMCAGTGDLNITEDNWEDCSYCKGTGYIEEEAPLLTEESQFALSSLSELICLILPNIKFKLCEKALDDNLLKVTDKIYPEYKILKSVKNF